MGKMKELVGQSLSRWYVLLGVWVGGLGFVFFLMIHPPLLREQAAESYLEFLPDNPYHLAIMRTGVALRREQEYAGNFERLSRADSAFQSNVQTYGFLRRTLSSFRDFPYFVLYPSIATIYAGFLFDAVDNWFRKRRKQSKQQAES
jgi:hypothetical protein